MQLAVLRRIEKSTNLLLRLLGVIVHLLGGLSRQGDNHGFALQNNYDQYVKVGTKINIDNDGQSVAYAAHYN